MAQQAVQAPAGEVLTRLEDTLAELSELPELDYLTGSQIRVLDSILRQIARHVGAIQQKLRLNWEVR